MSTHGLPLPRSDRSNASLFSLEGKTIAFLFFAATKTSAFASFSGDIRPASLSAFAKTDRSFADGFQTWNNFYSRGWDATNLTRQNFGNFFIGCLLAVFNSRDAYKSYTGLSKARNAFNSLSRIPLSTNITTRRRHRNFLKHNGI